jgi:hypothetical protein
MEEAIFGLVGVIVGGLLTGGVQLWLEQRKEKRAVSRAKRLVQGELLNAILIYRSMYSTASKTWPYYPDPTTALPTSAWQEHRADLASVLDEQLWQELVWAYALIEVDRTHLAVAKDSAPAIPLTEPVIEDLKKSVERFEELYRQLGGESPPQRQLPGR